jgi:hypothetical protein
MRLDKVESEKHSEKVAEVPRGLPALIDVEN